MRGKKDMPMHENPFRLFNISVFKLNGELLFKRPMLLIAIGDRRDELSLIEVWKAYKQRYDIEHGHACPSLFLPLWETELTDG